LDLILYYFNLFPWLKLGLQGTLFDLDEEIRAVVKAWVMNQNEDFYHRDITKVVLCQQKYVTFRGNYAGVT
jgi:hypothetical protein